MEAIGLKTGTLGPRLSGLSWASGVFWLHNLRGISAPHPPLFRPFFWEPCSLGTHPNIPYSLPHAFWEAGTISRAKEWANDPSPAVSFTAIG